MGMRIRCYGEWVLPSTGACQPTRGIRWAGGTLTRTAARRRYLPALLLALVLAMAAAVVALQCAVMAHHGSAAEARPHHAVAAGSVLQRTDIAASVHNHIGAAQTWMCQVSDGLAVQMSTPAVPKMTWIAALPLVAAVALAMVFPAWTRGPPRHTVWAATTGGRTLIYRLCVLRR